MSLSLLLNGHNSSQCTLPPFVAFLFMFVKAQLWNLAQRTTALPFGRGAFTLATIYTLLTEVLPYSKSLSLSLLMGKALS